MEIVTRNLQRAVPIEKERLIQALRKAGSILSTEDTEISIVFVNDKRMQELNRRYRKMDRTTDVLSFPMFESKRELLKAKKGHPSLAPGEKLFLGEIIINPHQVKRQAQLYGNTFQEELLRVALHGLLHLLGYDHERNSYQAKKMKERETFLFNAIKEMG